VLYLEPLEELDLQLLELVKPPRPHVTVSCAKYPLSSLGALSVVGAGAPLLVVCQDTISATVGCPFLRFVLCAQGANLQHTQIYVQQLDACLGTAVGPRTRVPEVQFGGVDGRGNYVFDVPKGVFDTPPSNSGACMQHKALFKLEFYMEDATSWQCYVAVADRTTYSNCVGRGVTVSLF
jgi:hypothetical protein